MTTLSHVDMLTRRQTIQCGFVSAGICAVGPSLFARFGEEHQTSTAAATTLESTIVPKGHVGYRVLGEGPAYPLVVRSDLAEPRKSRDERRTNRGVVVQLTDLHLVDVQSPMRTEFLDRRIGKGHRPQELLTTHGATALIQRINQLGVGPQTGRAIDAVMTTGDNTDNQSGTELEWLLTILAGGEVHPDSGGTDFEGVADSGLTEYWQPESQHSDRYKAHHFPAIPGLIKAATQPFQSPGLEIPWLLTMGNHDDTSLGTLANRPYVAEWSAGHRKVFSASTPDAVALAALTLRRHAGHGDVAAVLRDLARRGYTRRVAADERRVPFTSAEYVAALRSARFIGAGPPGHGYGPHADGSRLYYSHWLSSDVLAVSLDTTNQAGGADGSVGTGQLHWLERQLTNARDAYVVVFSHHPSGCMENLAPDPRHPHERRHSGRELLDVLHRHRNVVAWVNGHTHRNRISAHRHADPRRSFWEVNTVSHVDAPQQARVIELASNGDGTISLFTTMVDADSPARPAYDDLTPSNLAGLYRELAYNDLAFHDRRGSAKDRNTELLLKDPLGP